MDASPHAVCVYGVPHQHVPMRPRAASEAAAVSRAPPSDLEMVYESLLLHYAELATDTVEVAQEAVLAAASRVWQWLHPKLRVCEAQVTELPLPQPAVYPLSSQHMSYIADNFDDVRTQLQLIHYAVDETRTQQRLVRGARTESHDGADCSEDVPELELEVPVILDRNHVDGIMQDLTTFYDTRFSDILREHQGPQHMLEDDAVQAASSQQPALQDSERLLQFYQLLQ